jgi:hypothetical protein
MRSPLSTPFPSNQINLAADKFVLPIGSPVELVPMAQLMLGAMVTEGDVDGSVDSFGEDLEDDEWGALLDTDGE